MFKHILVPLDGSALAECVLPHVVAHARAFEAQVTLLRVLECPAATGRAQPVDPVDWEMQKAEARAYLEALVVSLQDKGVQAQSVLLEGYPPQRIIEYAHANQVDLIAVSSHGQSGLTGWNISSVVQKILKRAHVSMLIVRAYQPAPEITTEFHYRRIMVPLDGSRRAECALLPATTLAEYHAAQLLLVHVVHKPEMPRRAPLSQEDIELANRLIERNRQEAEAYLEQLRGRLTGDVEVRLLISDDVAVSLHDLATQEQVDLVILSAHGYSGRAEWPYGSVTTSFIDYGATPLLVVQDLAPDEVAPTLAELAAKERQGH